MLQKTVLGVLLTMISWGVMAIDYTTYIVNGSNATLSTHPDFVSLFVDRTDYDGTYYPGSFCGGTLLNNQYILTAAHCIFDSSEPNEEYMLFTVAGQTENTSSFPYLLDTVRASEFYYFSSFSDSLSDLWANDIAIIKLESSLNALGSVTRPNDELSYRNSSESFSTIGMGLTASSGGSSGRLLSADMVYVDNTTCASDLPSTLSTSLTNQQICFKGSDSDANDLTFDEGVCAGDSGGPIYWLDGSTYKQVGITSFGPTPCGLNTVTGFFTEVADYNTWINNVLNGTISPQFVATDEKRQAYFDARSSSSSSSGGVFGFGWLLLLLTFGGMRRFYRD